TMQDGIITVDGSGWIEQHAMLAPLFARRRMRQLEPLIADAVRRLVASWASVCADEPVDVLGGARRLAFDVVATGLLGIEDDALADGLFDTLIDVDRSESVRLLYLAKRFRAGGKSASGFERSMQARTVERLDGLTGAVADAFLARASQPDDLIGSVMAHADFAAFTPERKRRFLCDLVATMLSAGYVTTGESIFWALYLLAKHPAAQRRAREEIVARASSDIGAVPMEAPPFLAAAINESQRLYPPVWLLGRVALRDVRVGDVEIAAGTRVVCSPYVLHRLPALWPDAAQYRPERFLPGASAAIVPRSHFPFGTGMRACLGRGLAMMEMSALLGTTLSRFDVTLASEAPLTLAAAYSMHAREQVLFRFRSLA
ncbi:MAG: cytochrome P450, partial [Comamonadaceae bacterium]